ncbi:hypothetical protein [Petroclostridium sp. X23]|uniref:hypothetical protein n=1 Tax=Petroclostridium sp. X23 TaxID=3045146 RepID=UPI0024AE759D|nr:hypothetical protein [Petroclostridium sp. X23]WHH61316.1 hypothetical protein QKW49_11695 [Petroclostridium sp. X23]
MDMNNLSMLFAVLGVFMLFLFIIGIVLYVLFAIGLYGMAKNQQLENEWFAWIPILQLYIIGKILKEIKIADYTISRLEIVLPVATLAMIVLSGIPVIGWLLGLAYFVFNIFVTYQLFKMYKGDKATLMTVLSFILFFMGPIYIFNLRNASPMLSKEPQQDIIM